jgi:hypothetical protein
VIAAESTWWLDGYITRHVGYSTLPPQDISTNELIVRHKLISRKDLDDIYKKEYVNNTLSLKLKALKKALREENLSKDKK